MIRLTIPPDLHRLRVSHYMLVSGGTQLRRMWWTLDGEPMWADPIEAEYEQAQRGGWLMRDTERSGSPLQM